MYCNAVFKAIRSIEVNENLWNLPKFGLNLICYSINFCLASLRVKVSGFNENVSEI